MAKWPDTIDGASSVKLPVSRLARATPFVIVRRGSSR